MPRTYKCYYCKKYIDNPEDQTEFHMGKQKKRSHKSCRNEHLKRQKRREENKEYYYKLEELMLDTFDIPQLTGVMRKHINSLFKKGFNFDVIYTSFKISAKSIENNLDKPWVYHYAIIQNNLVKAKSYLKNKKIEDEEHKLEKQDDNIVTFDTNKSKKIDTKDYSNILD